MYKFNVSRYLLFFSVLFFVGAISFFPKWIVDDAYITFRYAQNLANNFQFVYNLNSQPVEGYTGVLLPFILAIGIKLGISPDTFSQLIGVISFILCCIVLWNSLKEIGIEKIIRSVVIFIFVTFPFLYSHIFSGLETILFLLSIFLVFQFQLKLLKNSLQKVDLFLFSLVVLFCSLVRPEGILYSFISVTICLLYVYTERKNDFGRTLVSIFIFYGIPFLIYFLWKWNYYGKVFPNTYYVKAASFVFSFDSYNSFLEFIRKNLSYPLLTGIVITFLINLDKLWSGIKSGTEKTLDKEFLYVFLSVLLFSIILLVKYMHSDLLMNYAFRFFVPTIPLFVILIALLLNYGYKNLRELSQKYKLTHKMFLVVIIYFSVLHLMNITSDLESQVVRAAKYKTLIENVHIPAGKYIFSNFGADKKLLVHADAGAIPYYSRMETIDFGGLNDDYLSQRNKLNDQSMIDYFFDVNADILSITSNFKNKIQRDESSLNWTTLKKTLMEERFGNYTLVKIFETNSWNYYQFVFIKNELLTLYFPEVNTIFQFEGKYNSILLSE